MSTFVSRILPNEPIIGDDTDLSLPHVSPTGHVIINGEKKSRGLIPRDRAAEPPGVYGASEFGYDLIPESEWAGILEQQEKEKSSLTDQILESGLGPLDQNGVPFCWG